MKVKGFSAIITLMLVAFLATGLWAQSLISGDVVGTVTDSAGAVVPNATVTLKSEATGQVRNITTNASGNYRFPLLQPGQYQVSVTAQGFATQKKVVTVAVGQTPELNFALAVKGSTEVVEVSGEAPLLQTENGNSGTTFNQQQVNLLPNGGGDITAIAELAPGAVMSTGAGYGNFTANGMPANSNVFTVNGTNNMDPYFNVNNSGATNLSLGGSDVAEAAVVTNAYSAQYGQQVGAQVTYVTKSGSNGLHGEANWKWTGRSVSARDAFNAKSDDQPFSNNNQYSANIGGPIVKDKTFFFASTEGLRYVLPTSQSIWAPSSEYMSVIQSYIDANVPSESAVYKQLFDYYKNAPGYSTATHESPLFTYDGSPSGQAWDPARVLPLPTGVHRMTCTDPTKESTCDPTGLNEIVTWHGGANALSTEWLMTTRIDHNFTQYDRAFFRFHTDHGIQATYTDPINTGLFSNTSNQPAYGGQAQWTHIFKSGATNQLIASSDYYSAGFAQNAAGAAAFPYSIYAFYDMPFSSMGGENFNFPQGRDVHQHQLIDDYSTRKGNHTLKFGTNYRQYAINDYIFSRRTNVPYMLTYNYDFALGSMSVMNQRFPSQKSQNIGMWGLGVYAEDEYKASSKLTLTLGIRLEKNSNPTCADNCFSQLNNTWGGIVHDPSIPYSDVITTGLNKAFKDVDSILFGPRFGFAYSPLSSKNTVIRGGYGLFYDAVPGALIDNMASNYPGFTSLTDYSGDYIDGLGNGKNLWAQGATKTGWSNAWSNLSASNSALKSGYELGLTRDQIRANVIAAGASFSAPSYVALPAHFNTPMFQKYNLELQQAIGKNSSVNIAYNGAHGRNIAMQNGQVNAYVAPSAPVCDDSEPPVCHPGARPNGVSPFPTVVPDKRFGAVTQYSTDGFSNYNGLTLSFNHRMSASLQTQVNYTWSHSMDTVSSSGGAGIIYSNDSIGTVMFPGAVEKNYASSDYDMRHVLTANFVWQPRFDKWLNAPKVIGSDWNITGTMLAKTGTPFTVASNGVTVTYGAPAKLYPVIVGSTEYTCDSSAVSTACLNANAFADPTGANASISPQRRNMFRGPGYFDMDMTISKGFQVLPGHENMKLVLGMTAYNLLNHPNFATPCANISGTCGDLGVIYSTVSPATSPYGSFTGSAASARILQFNAKFSF